MRNVLLAAALFLSLSSSREGQAQAAIQGTSAWETTRPASTKARSRRVYSLEECLKLAVANYPKVHEARAKLAHKRAQAWEARTRPYSEFTLTAGLALAPTLRGTNIFSPDSDVTLSSDMALAWQFGLDGVVPLWTFGKIDSLWDAADAQVKVGEHELAKEKNDIKFAVHQAYYGVKLARDSLVLVKDALDRIGKYVVQLEEKVREGEGDDIELLKLKMHQAELQARESEARKGERVALAGLRFLTGVGETLDVADEPLRKSTHMLAPLSSYLLAARLFRPEINMARAGVLARQAQVRLEHAKYFPDIGLGLSYRFVRAPEITDQRNPFARDRANFTGYGIGLVLRWKLDFLPQAAKVAQARAQLEEMRATERFALGGIGVEVEQAYAEAVDARNRLEAWSRATQFAKQWLIKVQQGIDIGTFDDEDIVDPAKEYALKRFAEMKATFDYNMSIAKLGQVTGWEAVTHH